jgi:uncharacterized small protein (DUF1192 family)
MDLEDLEPRKQKVAPKNLEEMSVEALESYIADLEAEIMRAREAIDEKRKARQGAESIFRR